MTLLTFLVLTSLANAQVEIERFRALTRAATLEEHDRVRSRFDLYEAALLACEKELSAGKVPVNCFVARKVERRSPEPELVRRCTEAAHKTSQAIHAEHRRLLPLECLRALNHRERILAYKAGKTIE